MSFDNLSAVNSLGEISFIGGTDYTLEFQVFNQSGAPGNLSGATCSWKMCPYGEEENVTLSYSGTITGINTFEVHLLSADTLGLKGKFVHQPIVVDGSNNYRPQQGIISIIPAIG